MIPHSSPTVAHLMRTYLPRRAPFVGVQISALRRFRPIVISRYYMPFSKYEVRPTHISSQSLNWGERQWAELNYRVLRRLTRTETLHLAGVVAKEDVSLFHAHFAVDAGFFLPLIRQVRLPLVVSCYGYDTLWFASKYFGFGLRYLRAVYDCANLILAMSPDMKADLRALGCPEEKIVVHYHGVETTDFAYPQRTYDASPLTVLMVAAFEDYKGHLYLLQALHSLVRRYGDLPIRLRLVGEGPNRASLQRWVQQQGLDRYVTFLGFVTRDSGRIVSEYRGADLFVMPSVTTASNEKEGIPGALVEAMSAGLPVIASRHAGIPHVVQDGDTGILVDERDCEGIARALDRFIHDSALRCRLGRRAAEVANRSFDARVCAATLERLYSSLLSSSTS